MGAFIVDIDDPRAVDVTELLGAHLAFAKLHTPPQDVHALDPDSLLDDDITLFSVRETGRLVGVGALRHLDAGHVEIKSMHTAEHARGRGAGRAMLEHLVRVAIDRGYDRMSLETGTMAAFGPARTLYASAGFQVCDPFADYPGGSNSVCMTLELPSSV